MIVDGGEFTREEALAIANWDEVFVNGEDGWPAKNWHQGPMGGGAFEGRAIAWGYTEENFPGNAGFPLYAGLTVDGDPRPYHVYWRPDLNAIWIDPDRP
jgi:hypothetical protein